MKLLFHRFLCLVGLFLLLPCVLSAGSLSAQEAASVFARPDASVEELYEASNTLFALYGASPHEAPAAVKESAQKFIDRLAAESLPTDLLGPDPVRGFSRSQSLPFALAFSLAEPKSKTNIQSAIAISTNPRLPPLLRNKGVFLVIRSADDEALGTIASSLAGRTPYVELVNVPPAERSLEDVTDVAITVTALANLRTISEDQLDILRQEALESNFGLETVIIAQLGSRKEVTSEMAQLGLEISLAYPERAHELMPMVAQTSDLSSLDVEKLGKLMNETIHEKARAYTINLLLETGIPPDENELTNFIRNSQSLEAQLVILKGLIKRGQLSTSMREELRSAPMREEVLQVLGEEQ